MEKDSFAKLSHNLLIPLLGKIAQISKYAADDMINIFSVSVNLQKSTHLEVNKLPPQVPESLIASYILLLVYLYEICSPQSQHRTQGSRN